MELKSIYSSQKSFYNKANVIVVDNETRLQSYNTIVAIKSNNKIIVKGYYSKTTAIHINEFLQQNGVNKMNKKEMELAPIVEL